ncbi:hypothetical protein RRG08_029871 [Elysia crispata]|uniref:Uncharacterized protein n=1 Tax=Elysia crispata TaxID=231223 RepID=A0AAE1CZW7_9GAST|nr:hypothetical protein RRG08_029871 [Elysia crispata]
MDIQKRTPGLARCKIIACSNHHTYDGIHLTSLRVAPGVTSPSLTLTRSAPVTSAVAEVFGTDSVFAVVVARYCYVLIDHNPGWSLGQTPAPNACT